MIDNLGFWPRFILAILATWRITHLLAREDGPADLLVRLRRRLGDSFAGTWMDCFHCVSLWVAAALALWVSVQPLDWLFAWFALSGAACLLERSGHEKVIMHAIPEETKGQTDGMLR